MSWYLPVLAVMIVCWLVVVFIMIGEYLKAIGTEEEADVAKGLLLAFFGGLVLAFAWPVTIPVTFFVLVGFVIKSATKK